MKRLPRAGQRIRVASRPADLLVIANDDETGKPVLVFRFEDTQEAYCMTAALWPWHHLRQLAPALENNLWGRRPLSGEDWQGPAGPVGILANAIDAGNGGHIVVYRDKTTQHVHSTTAAAWFASGREGRSRFWNAADARNSVPLR